MSDFKVPAEVAAALMSMRPELLKLAPKTAMSAEQVQGLYEVLGNLIEDTYRVNQENKRLKSRATMGRRHMNDALESLAAARRSITAAVTTMTNIETGSDDDDDC